MKLTSHLALVISVLLMGGCASPWEKSFEPNVALADAKFPPTTSVEVRTIPFERYQRYVEDERARRIASATAPSELSTDDQRAEKQRLLETLQVSESPDELDILGFSEFVTSDRLSPRDPNLQKFARRIGADRVVVTSNYLGQVTRIQDRPVTTYSQGFTTFTRARGGRRGRAISYTDQSTTWVPMQVTEDQFFYEAVFLRMRR